MKKTQKFGFIGFGLIGGSIAKAIRLFLPDSILIAYDIDTPSLYAAAQDGMLNTVCDSIDERYRSCDYIFLCAPVTCNEEYLSVIKPYLRSDAILTDVGSVKGGMHRAVRKLGLEHNFIGGHPMTGSEKTGYANAKALLLENAYYILTPEPEVPKEKVTEYTALVETLHGLPILLDSDHHDEITSVISHLPHIIASGLVNFVRTKDDSEERMRELVAGGFKDITRIASSSPAMWESICLSNSDWIVKTLHDYIDSLSDMAKRIEDHDRNGIVNYFSEARDYRDSIPDRKSGPITMSYVLYCDLIDEAGGIATIATILATNGISIKNIGIIHNREFEEGVLRMEFYDDASLEQGIRLLKRHHYTIYTR